MPRPLMKSRGTSTANWLVFAWVGAFVVGWWAVWLFLLLAPSPTWSSGYGWAALSFCGTVLAAFGILYSEPKPLPPGPGPRHPDSEKRSVPRHIFRRDHQMPQGPSHRRPHFLNRKKD